MKTLRTLLRRIAMLSLCSLLFAMDARAVDRVLGFPQTFQEHSNWCWAAVSHATLEFFGTHIDQCVIANYQKGRSDCCGNTTFDWSHPCNTGAYLFGAGVGVTIRDILGHWGVDAGGTFGGPMSKATCVAQLNAGRSFVMGWGWTGGGGHFLAGFGYTQDGNYLWYMDPWPGNGNTLSTYDFVANGPGHLWDNSLWGLVPGPGNARGPAILSIVNSLLQ